MDSKLPLYRTIKEGFLFIIASGIGFVINLGITAFLHEVLGIAPGISFAVALACAYVANYFNNRTWVFVSDAAPLSQIGRFLGLSLFFRILEYLMFTVLHYVLGVYYLVAVFGSLISFYFIKFFAYKKLVFTSKDTGRTLSS